MFERVGLSNGSTNKGTLSIKPMYKCTKIQNNLHYKYTCPYSSDMFVRCQGDEGYNSYCSLGTEGAIGLSRCTSAVKKIR